jgi:putative peptidoglycan lipid II flippase
VALGVVLLPQLSAAKAQEDPQAYSDLLDWGLRLVVLLALPFALALLLIPHALVSVLYHYGRFSPADVAQTVDALRGYGVGLVGLIAVKVLAPGFYARQDIRTPVRIAIVVLVATQAMNLVFVPRLGHDGLALSIGLGGLLNAAWLMVGLRRRGLWQPARGWARFLAQVGAGCAVLGAGLAAVAGAVPWVGLQASPLWRAGALGGVVLAAAVLYLGTLHLCGLRVRAFARRVR